MTGEIIQISPDIIMCRGNHPDNYLTAPYISNCVVVREGADLFVIDSGAGDKMQSSLVQAVEMLREGTDSLYLINTTASVAYFSNNKAVMEIPGFKEVRHLVHEKAKPRFDHFNHNIKVFETADRYYDVFEAPPPPWRSFTRLLGLGNRRKGIERVLKLLYKQYTRVESSLETVTFLQDEQEEAIEIGPVTVKSLSMSGDVVAIDLGPLKIHGWKISDAVIVHTEGPNPEHIVVFFPKKKLMATGCLTWDMFPAMPGHSEGKKMVEAMRWILDLNKEGLVDILIDSVHDEPLTTDSSINKMLVEIIRNKKDFKQALLSLIKPGEKKTIRDLYRELRNIRFDVPAVDRYLDMQFPRSPVFLKDVMANILLGAGATIEGSGRNATFEIPD